MRSDALTVVVVFPAEPRRCTDPGVLPGQVCPPSSMTYISTDAIGGAAVDVVVDVGWNLRVGGRHTAAVAFGPRLHDLVSRDAARVRHQGCYTVGEGPVEVDVAIGRSVKRDEGHRRRTGAVVDVDRTGYRRDRGVALGVRARQDHAHHGAHGESREVDAAGVDAELLFDVVDQLFDVSHVRPRFTHVPDRLAHPEPVV